MSLKMPYVSPVRHRRGAQTNLRCPPRYYGFDPLNIVGGMSPLAVKNMQAKEINNGRLAMVAVVAYVVQEAMTGEPVTSVSEQFFTPIIYYPWVQHLLTDAFGIASFRS